MSDQNREFEPRENREVGDDTGWILRALENLRGDIRDLKDDVKEFRRDTDTRLRKLEIKAAYLVGGLAVALGFATFAGWILAPVVRVLAQKALQ